VIKNNKIITAHVGGRAGSIGFPDNSYFEHEIEKIIFEADEDCLDQIKDVHPNSKTLNFFIGKNNENITFNINYCPYTSSAYKLNSQYENFYHKGAKNTDYVFKHVMKSQKEINLVSRSLDSLHDEGIIEAPNFLSIDTQGSEYDVLLSAERIIKNNILAINCEINFSELYLNSKLFNEIHLFLTKNDFFLVNIETFNIGYHRIPNKFRGKGIPLQGEVLYLKDPNKIINDLSKKSNLLKLAFIAISFGYTEFSYKILDENFSKEIDFNLDYEKFLNNFYQNIKDFKIMPKLWNDEFTFEDSLRRFNNETDGKIKKINIFIKIFNKIKYYINKIKREDYSFVKFLKRNGFLLAAKEVEGRIRGKL